MDLIKNFTSFNNKHAFILFEENFHAKKTYVELNEEILDIRNYLSNKLNLPQHICVGISIKTTSVTFFSSIYSVLQNNMAFTLFEPKQSLKNIKIIKGLQLRIIIADEDSIKNFKDLGLVFNEHKFSSSLGSEIIFIEIQDFEIKTTFKNIMYVIQTSGTTGENKYVRVTHESIHSNIDHLRKIFELTENDYIYFGTPLSFDPCIIEIFLSMSIGATLVVISPQIRRRPDLLKQIIFPESTTLFPGVTVLQMCPSVFQRWSEKDIDYILNHTSLRILALGGEQFPDDILLVNRKARIFNLYGITEVSCWASICEIKNGEVNLGTPLNDTILQVRKLQDSRTLVEEGEGVLFLGSHKRICLIKDENFEDLNLPLFRCSGDIVSIKDNVIKYKGRMNNMIKRYGHNINLAMVEQKMIISTQLRNKCIWLSNINKIVAFICLPKNNKLDYVKICDKIRAKLLRELNDYEMPDLFEVVDEFPLTENGKIDNNHLIKLALRKFDDQEESILDSFQALWKKYFDLEEIPNDKTFFEMGGSSILLLQFVEELKIRNKKIGNEFINILAISVYESICCYLRINSSPESKSLDIIKPNQLGTQVFCVKWKFNTQSCVDVKPSIINISNACYLAVGNFAGRFVIISEINMEKVYDNWFPKSIENGCKQINNLIFFGCYDSYFYCINLITTEIKWKFETGDKIKNVGCIVLNGTGIVFGSYDKYLYCINIKDGQCIWKIFLDEAVTASVKSRDEMLFIGGLRGKIICVHELNGKILWEYKTKHPIFSSAEFVTGFDGIVFSDVCSFLYCFDIKTGNMKWIYEPEQPRNLYSSILIKDAIIFFGTSDKYVYSLQFDDNSCQLLNVLNIGHKITSTPVFYKDTYIIFASSDGFIFLINFCDNKLDIINFFILGNECFSSPAVSNNQLFIGCRDNFVYNIDINLS